MNERLEINDHQLVSVFFMRVNPNKTPLFGGWRKMSWWARLIWKLRGKPKTDKYWRKGLMNYGIKQERFWLYGGKP